MADQPADYLTVRFPAQPGYLEISRLNATAMAAELGFDVEELDDLRLAVDEAVAWLVGESSAGTVELRINRSPGELQFTGTRRGPDGPGCELYDLIHAILGATTDGYEAGRDDDGCRFLRLVKRAANG